MGETVKETFVPEDNVAPVVLTGLRGFVAKFTVLKGAQRELWLTFLIKFFIYTAYSVTNKTMVLWLSKDLGFSDRLGLGAGDDHLHVACRVDHGCDRASPHLLPRCRHLHGRSQRDGR